jgi:prepilin-type N-terminal cleavage/methylation domain-containing protein
MRFANSRGFTLIELVIVIIILSILATVATRQLGTTVDTAKYEQTKNEMDALAAAIRGSEELYESGARTDFGYVGDVGALPPNLDALVQNPGGYATWKGPYIDRGIAVDDFKKDGWGASYTYQDTMIRSSGSGVNIDKLFAARRADLLSNSVEGYLTDADRTPPTTAHTSSVCIQLLHPNGAGGMAIDSTQPTASGYFAFANIPIGNHTLRVIYTPQTDSVTIPVAVYPQRATRLNVIFPADLW